MSAPSPQRHCPPVSPAPGRDDLSERRLLRSAAQLGMPGQAHAAAPSRRGDWDLVFAAVTDRLRRAASSRLDAAALAQLILECAEALDQLHASLDANPG